LLWSQGTPLLEHSDAESLLWDLDMVVAEREFSSPLKLSLFVVLFSSFEPPIFICLRARSAG